MPVMDGLTATRQIRKFERSGKMKRVPILAVSANARMEQIAEAKDAGMDDAIVKPFRIAEILPKIELLSRLGAQN
jgi:CheY-like chemotaxis protein